MKYEELRTPSLLIDYEQFQKNCADMAEKADRLQLSFCPHVKTHKTIKGAVFQLNSRMFGITVSTLAEAWYYAENGFKRITYAFPVTIDKLPEICELIEITDEFRLVTDSEQTISEMMAYAEEHEIEFSVFLKVDSGAHRAGLAPDSDTLVQLARRIVDSPYLYFEGILSHAGHTYSAKNRSEIAALAKIELTALETAVERLQKAGIEPETVSIGDTPGCVTCEDFGPATELRPGNYTFFDRMQVDIGTCTEKEVAAFVLSRVIGAYPERNTLLIDAGALALSKDLGATHIRKDGTYGKVMENEDFKLAKLSQEHGLITSDKPIPFDAFPVGSYVTIMPNHSCLTAALHEHFIVVNNMKERKILDSWKPVRGW